MYNVEDAPPAGKSRDTFGQIAFVSESIIHRLSRIRGGLRSDLGDLLHLSRVRARNRKIDHQWTCDDRPSRHKTPEAGVKTAIPVVAEDEILALRHHKFTVLSQALHLAPPVRIDLHPKIRIAQNIAGKVIASGAMRRGFKGYIWLVEGHAIHDYVATGDAKS